MSKDYREPQAFVLDEAMPGKSRLVTRSKARGPALEFEIEPALPELLPPLAMAAAAPRQRFRWLAVLVSAAFGLIVMGATLSIIQLVESFFVRSPYLGWLTLSLAGLLAIAALAMIVREVAGLLRLNKIEALQEKSSRAINLDEGQSADSALAELESLYANRPDMNWHLGQFKSHRDDILDPRDRMRLAERHLMEPLDVMAHKIIARRARRVTLLTTVTPAAALDILFVATQNFGMLREIATLYGGKPSTLATFKLARMVVAHLAIAGGLSLSDSFIQHFIGKGLLGKLSARFGEGAVNGILTARIGLATSALCRPIPRQTATRETLTSLLREVFNFGSDASKPKDISKMNPEPQD